MSDWVDVVIVTLLPLTALFTVVQTHPYFALLSRGIMGMVAVLFYAAMGAPDVALTEALVGTLLTVMLFAIAVRSSLAMRIGTLEGRARPPQDSALRIFCRSQRLALRWVSFSSEKELAAALKAGRVDAVYGRFDRDSFLGRLLPDGVPPDENVALLAEHCRWHERRMKSLSPDAGLVERLKFREKYGAH